MLWLSLAFADLLAPAPEGKVYVTHSVRIEGVPEGKVLLVFDGPPGGEVEAMRVYGLELGMAFQIMDDALDYTASAKQMGKNAGDDFADQKITLPTILAWRDGDAEERAFWQRTLGEADFAEGDLERAQALLASHDAVNRSVAVAHDHAVKAGAALTPFIGDERTAPLAHALANAALFAAHRAS